MSLSEALREKNRFYYRSTVKTQIILCWAGIFHTIILARHEILSSKPHFAVNINIDKSTGSHQTFLYKQGLCRQINQGSQRGRAIWPFSEHQNIPTLEAIFPGVPPQIAKIEGWAKFLGQNLSPDQIFSQSGWDPRHDHLSLGQNHS